ncbi:MAG: hypothetical protein QM765_43500 [Myxococcales bacterium]
MLQLNLEANAGRPLSLRLYGLPDARASLDEAVAIGAATGSCEAGRTCQVGVPFNLKPSLAAPRVILVSPPDDPSGENKVNDRIVAVSAVLSTLVDGDSARAHARVIGPDGKTASLSVIVDEVAFTLGGETARRTSLTFQLSPPLAEGPHTIEIGPGLVSVAGRRFDQNPATAEEDAFRSSFQTLPTFASNGCTCDPGYECYEPLHGCRPAMTCPTTCVSGYTCDLAQHACVEDCRVLALCAGACDTATGLCR